MTIPDTTPPPAGAPTESPLVTRNAPRPLTDEELELTILFAELDL